KNNGEYRLTARHADSPSESASWSWTGPADTSGQVGFACWGSTDAHFTHARVYSLAARDGGPGDELAIESATVSGGNLVLEISNPGGAPYDVEVSETLAPGSWVITAAGQTGD